MTERDITADELPEYFAVLDALDKVDDVCRRFGFPGPVDQLPAWLAKRFEQDAETYAAGVKMVDELRAWKDRVVGVARAAGFETDPIGIPGWLHLHLQTRVGEAEAKRAELERARNERDGWMDSAAQMSRNAEFYRGIVTRIGKSFGAAAYTSDDGSAQDTVLALKVPELVDDLRAEIAAVKRVDDEHIAHKRVVIEELRAQLGGLTAACERFKLELAEARETIAALKPHTNH